MELQSNILKQWPTNSSFSSAQYILSSIGDLNSLLSKSRLSIKFEEIFNLALSG
jgi:hypothetical protein